MPGPMPPPGPPPSGPPGQAPGQTGSISNLLQNVDQAIDHLNQVIGQSKATSPEEKQMIGMVDQIYGKLMSSLGQGDQGGDDDSTPGNGQGQTVPPEAGGNKGAVPSPM